MTERILKRELYSVKETARLTGYHAAYIYQLRRDGKIQHMPNQQSYLIPGREVIRLKEQRSTCSRRPGRSTVAATVPATAAKVPARMPEGSSVLGTVAIPGLDKPIPVLELAQHLKASGYTVTLTNRAIEVSLPYPYRWDL